MCVCVTDKFPCQMTDHWILSCDLSGHVLCSTLVWVCDKWCSGVSLQKWAYEQAASSKVEVGRYWVFVNMWSCPFIFKEPPLHLQYLLSFVTTRFIVFDTGGGGVL